MKKILSFFAAVLVTLAVNAQTIVIDGSNADWADVPMLTEPGESPVLKMIVPQTGATLPDGAAYCLMVEGNHPQIVAGYPVIYTDADKSTSTGTVPWFCPQMGYDYEMATWSDGSLFAENDPDAATIREMCIMQSAFTSIPFSGSFYGWLTFGWGALFIPSTPSDNGWKWSEATYLPLNVAPYSYADINGTHQAAAVYSTHAALTPGASLNMKNSGSANDTLLWASWPVELTTPGVYSVSADVQSTNASSVDLCLVNSANNQVVASFRSAEIDAPSGNTVFGDFDLRNVPAGKYVMKFSNHVAWSEMVLSSITLTPKVFTVAGSNTAVFGTSWDVDNTDNDMVLNAGIYSLTKENVLLPAGTIKFKVVTNHSWDNTSYPENDYELSIPDAGTYDITISFDFSQGNEGVAVVAGLKELFTLEDGFYLIGKINGVEGWNVTDLTANRKLVTNPANNAELMITDVTIAFRDEIKVVKVEDNAITNWYPYGVGNYWLDEFHTGVTNVFFRETPDWSNDNW